MMRGSRDETICPKLPALELTIGGPFRTPLSRLKASARTCRYWRSRIRNSLVSAASNCQKPGPRTLAVPMLPNVPDAGSGTPSD